MSVICESISPVALRKSETMKKFRQPKVNVIVHVKRNLLTSSQVKRIQAYRQEMRCNYINVILVWHFIDLQIETNTM